MTTINSVGNGLSGATGSGNFVGATSPTLVTPAIGTPASGTLTNCTGLPASTGISGLGTGVATALGANVTGSGGIVLATSPSLTTPALGTPSSGTLTNCTGLPYTGISAGAWTSWTPTVTGFSGSPTVSGNYVLLGKLIIVNFSINGTSNSVSFTCTNLPATVANISFNQTFLVAAIDNTVTSINAECTLTANSTTATFTSNNIGGGWTNTGTKQAIGTIIYQTT